MTDKKHYDASFIDIRGELGELVPHFQWYGLRQVDYSRQCSCMSQAPDGIPGSGGCNRCLRTGFLFTDLLVKGYMWSSSLGFMFNTKVGQISTDRCNFVVKHDKPINKFDYIVVLDTNSDTGRLVQPLRIIRYYSVQDSIPLYGKNGRIEFFKCSLEERNLDDGRPNSKGTGFSYKSNRPDDLPW